MTASDTDLTSQSTQKKQRKMGLIVSYITDVSLNHQHSGETEYIRFLLPCLWRAAFCPCVGKVKTIFHISKNQQNTGCVVVFWYLNGQLEGAKRP